MKLPHGTTLLSFLRPRSASTTTACDEAPSVRSTLEGLPRELLIQILGYVYLSWRYPYLIHSYYWYFSDIIQSALGGRAVILERRRNQLKFAGILLTSRALYTCGIGHLYSEPIIDGKKSLHAFVETVTAREDLSALVRLIEVQDYDRKTARYGGGGSVAEFTRPLCARRTLEHADIHMMIRTCQSLDRLQIILHGNADTKLFFDRALFAGGPQLPPLKHLDIYGKLPFGLAVSAREVFETNSALVASLETMLLSSLRFGSIPFTLPLSSTLRTLDLVLTIGSFEIPSGMVSLRNLSFTGTLGPSSCIVNGVSAYMPVLETLHLVGSNELAAAQTLQLASLKMLMKLTIGAVDGVWDSQALVLPPSLKELVTVAWKQESCCMHQNKLVLSWGGGGRPSPPTLESLHLVCAAGCSAQEDLRTICEAYDINVTAGKLVPCCASIPEKHLATGLNPMGVFSLMRIYLDLRSIDVRLQGIGEPQ